MQVTVDGLMQRWLCRGVGRNGEAPGEGSSLTRGVWHHWSPMSGGGRGEDGQGDLQLGRDEAALKKDGQS